MWSQLKGHFWSLSVNQCSKGQICFKPKNSEWAQLSNKSSKFLKLHYIVSLCTKHLGFSLKKWCSRFLENLLTGALLNVFLFWFLNPQLKHHQKAHNHVYVHPDSTLLLHCPLKRIWMLLYNRDQLWHDKPHRLPHHLFDNRGHRKQCRFPPREPWISLPGRRGGGLWGVAGLYQHIQTQLTTTPTILFAGCICWVGDLSLKAGQVLNFLIWHISEAKSSSRGSTALLYFLYVHASSLCFM